MTINFLHKTYYQECKIFCHTTLYTYKYRSSRAIKHYYCCSCFIGTLIVNNKIFYKVDKKKNKKKKTQEKTIMGQRMTVLFDSAHQCHCY